MVVDLDGPFNAKVGGATLCLDVVVSGEDSGECLRTGQGNLLLK